MQHNFGISVNTVGMKNTGHKKQVYIQWANRKHGNMATKLTALRLTEEDKAHIKNIKEGMELATDTYAVRMVLKRLSEHIERAKAKRQEQLQEL